MLAFNLLFVPILLLGNTLGTETNGTLIPDILDRQGPKGLSKSL
jgi:hypothetical protein